MDVLRITKFNGGFSSGDKIGTVGSFFYGQNLDIHSEPDKLQVSPVATKDSGSIITDLVLFMTSEGVNNDVYALGDTGNFYKRTASTGVWSLLRTLGGANGQGLGYFNNLIYYASGNSVGTYNPATGAFNETVHSLNAATWHPMACFLDKIVIGNGIYLASIDASTIWSSDNLMLITDYEIKCLEVLGGGNWLGIGTTKADKTDARFFTWDGYSTNYNDVITINENGINAITNNQGMILINAGTSGNIYQYNGSSLVKLKSFPLIEKNLTALCYPGSVCNFRGNSLLAVSTGSSLTVNRTVYSWTSKDKNYPKVLNSEFTPSHGNLTGTTNEIGSLFSEGESSLFISWKNGSSYGVDLVDGTGAFATAEYQSIIFDIGRVEYKKFFNAIKLRLARILRTGESIDVYYDADRTGSWTAFAENIDFATDGAIIEKTIPCQLNATELQIRIVFTNTNNTSSAIAAVLLKLTITSNAF